MLPPRTGPKAKRVPALLIALLLVLFRPALGAAPAWAGAHIVDPWPDPAGLDAIRPVPVTFPSSSPFDPAAAGRKDTPPATATAELYLPPGAAPDHTTPAVVMLHGAAGLVAERGEAYGPQLAAMGVAVLVIDTFGSRRDLATTFTQRVLNITETMFVADAYAGLRYLATRPEIDAGHVVLAGFSYGGMATMYALYAQMADRLAPPDLRFAGHVSFYGPCIARFADSRTTGAPVLMLYGAQDELIRPDRCARIADDLRGGGSAVRIVSYPGAVHQWDGGMARRMIGRNLSACSFRVDRQGAIHDAGSGVAMTGPLTRKLLLLFCVSSRPYPIGADAAVRRQSDRDFGHFLAGVFAAPNPALHRLHAARTQAPSRPRIT